MKMHLCMCVEGGDALRKARFEPSRRQASEIDCRLDGEVGVRLRLRQTLPQDGAKTAHFCSMRGPHFCSMSRSCDERRNRSEAEIARHFAPELLAGKQTTRSVARRTMLWGRSIDNITEDVRKYAAEQGIAADVVLDIGMEKKSKECVEKGAEVYVKT